MWGGGVRQAQGQVGGQQQGPAGGPGGCAMVGAAIKKRSTTVQESMRYAIGLPPDKKNCFPPAPRMTVVPSAWTLHAGTSLTLRFGKQQYQYRYSHRRTIREQGQTWGLRARREKDASSEIHRGHHRLSPPPDRRDPRLLAAAGRKPLAWSRSRLGRVDPRGEGDREHAARDRDPERGHPDVDGLPSGEEHGDRCGGDHRAG